MLQVRPLSPLFRFSAITWYTAALLCDAYRVGDPLTGKQASRVTHTYCLQQTAAMM